MKIIILLFFIIIASTPAFAQKKFSHVWFIQGIETAYQDALFYPKKSDTPEIILEVAISDYESANNHTEKAKALYSIHYGIRLALVHYIISKSNNKERLDFIKKTFIKYMNDEKAWNHIYKLFRQKLKKINY